jgi:hypothetical protein
MAITGTDILQKLSVTTGAAGNSVGGTPAGSLGKYISTTAITDATLDNLFDDISGDENTGSVVDYRCYFIHNNHGTLTWQNVVAYISAETAGGASVSIGVDTTAASALANASAQAVTVATELTAPAGASFTAPTTKATGIALGSIAAGQVRGLWVRRTAANNAALDLDSATVTCAGDTAA